MSQAHDQLLDSLASLPRLLGAAVALGAERVPGLSSAERSLGREIQVVPPKAPELRRLTSLIRDGQDPLGDAFCIMRTAADRRVDGATYTPPSIIAAMVGWASNGTVPVRTIDPGAGSGRFTVAAGLTFPKAQLVAVELDPVAAMLCRANIAVHKMESRALVTVEDYRDFTPGPPIDGPSLYIGNPPYVRHHQIAPEWKRWLTATARGRDLDASQLAGLHVYFFLATAQHASPGDRGVFITASEWLDVNYGALVRDLALDGLGGQAIHLIEPEAKPFEDADTTGAIMCFEVGSKPPTVRLRRAKSAADLGNLTGGQPIRRERLAEARRWTPLTRAARKIPDGHIELGELCRVHRGAVTGANRVFVVDAASDELPPEVMFATVTRARELFNAGAALHPTTSLRRVVDIPPDLDHFGPDARKLVDRFLRRAKRLGVHEGYVARHRPAWWSVGLRTPAPILATYMARKAPAIVRNIADARHINIAHGLYPREPMDDGALDRLAKALQDSITIGEGRTYAGGLTKFEPREMERLMVPNITATPA